MNKLSVLVVSFLCAGLASHSAAADTGHPLSPFHAPGELIPKAKDPGERSSEELSRLAESESRDYDGLNPTTKRWLHGFRIGTIYVANHDRPIDPMDPESSIKEKYDLKEPWLFAIGYEGMRRIVGHSWLNVILVGNVTIAGLEQSRPIPSANGLIGFEFNESFQMGVGVNVTPEEGKEVHMIGALGWTPRVGRFYMPVHFTLVPDVDGNHRIGSTLGVNW